MKRVYRDKKASVHWSAARTKSASRPVDKPRINRSSTADFVPAFGLHNISLVRASGGTFRRRFHDALESTRVLCLLGEQFCWHPVPRDPAPPPRCAPRPDLPVVCPGFGLDRYMGQQPRTKSAHGPADKPQINRLSTAGFVLRMVCIGFLWKLVVSLLERVDGSRSSWGGGSRVR